jgi:hypothetical protein
MALFPSKCALQYYDLGGNSSNQYSKAKKRRPEDRLFEYRSSNQGLVGELLFPPAAITIPPITAAAARTAIKTPLPPPILFSVLRTAPTRLTFDTETALATGAAAAKTGALTNEAAAIAASEILPKRIVMLLIFHTKCLALPIVYTQKETCFNPRIRHHV